MTAAALMSNHSLEAEESTYAGEAHVGGVEGIERKDFKILSQAFNDRVYVAEVKDLTTFSPPVVQHPVVASQGSASPPAPVPRQVLNSQGFIVMDTVIQDMQAAPVLLALRPGSGKTQAILQLLHPSRLLLVIVPTQALQQQVP
jgi:hypothetical protein